MAEGKKSFVLYSDSQGLINQLPDEVAGRLLKHIFSYVNDENPVSEELLLNVAFEPIKMQLKRDLANWKESKNTKSINGRMGNLNRYNPDLYENVKSEKITLEEAEIIAKSRKASQGDSLQSQEIAKFAVNVNDNVSVNVNVNNIEERKLKFSSNLKDFISVYGQKIIDEFYAYWTEPNKSNTKFRQELEKTWDLERRLKTWAKNDINFNKNKNEPIKTFDRRNDPTM